MAIIAVGNNKWSGQGMQLCEEKFIKGKINSEKCCELTLSLRAWLSSFRARVPNGVQQAFYLRWHWCLKLNKQRK